MDTFAEDLAIQAILGEWHPNTTDFIWNFYNVIVAGLMGKYINYVLYIIGFVNTDI